MSERHAKDQTGETRLVLLIDPTARVSADLVIRGHGVVEIDAHAVIEDRVIIDLGSSGAGRVHLGARSKIKTGVIIRCYNGRVVFGLHTSIGDYCVIHGHGGLEVGDDVGVGPHCTIAASQHIAEAVTTPIRYQGETARGIAVEDNVWVGAGCQVLDGVTIRRGGVIGAGSVVSKSTPADYICVGVPCRPLRPRSATRPPLTTPRRSKTPSGRKPTMRTALTNCDIYTGDEVLTKHAIVIADGMIEAVSTRVPRKVDTVIDLEGKSVSAGFIDLQVNGGGDVLLNDDPSAEGVRAIAAGHRRFGTTDILPTFITGRLEDMKRAADAVRSAGATEQGILGIHFEGPLLSEAKLGVHDRAHLMAADEEVTAAFASLNGWGKTLVTLAPEVVPPGYIRSLVDRGILVAAGHTNATAKQMDAAFEEGTTLGTHVWNAMSPITSREPGAVGAFLSSRNAWCDFVADGHHVDFSVLGISIRAAAPRAFLVTDAMSPVGGTKGGYKLGDLEVVVRNGRCETADGVIAGSALDLATAVRNLIQKVGIPKDEALRMATTYPAAYLGVSDSRGRVAQGYPAHLAVFDNEINVTAVYYAGELHTVV